MKIILVAFGLCLACILFAPSAHATDFVFSSFQCDPVSCQDSGIFDVVSEASVSVDAFCTGSGIEFHKLVKAQVGIDPVTGEVEPCNSPYEPKALVERHTTELVDDFGCPYNLDTMRLSAEIFDSLGGIRWSAQQEFSCDGGEGAPTVFGTRPC